MGRDEVINSHHVIHVITFQLLILQTHFTETIFSYHCTPRQAFRQFEEISSNHLLSLNWWHSLFLSYSSNENVFYTMKLSSKFPISSNIIKSTKFSSIDAHAKRNQWPSFSLRPYSVDGDSAHTNSCCTIYLMSGRHSVQQKSIYSQCEYIRSQFLRKAFQLIQSLIIS